MSSSMRREMSVAAAGDRAGAAPISRDFGARAFAGLGNFAAINSPSEDRRGTTRGPRSETSNCDNNIENYIVNNFRPRYDRTTDNKRADPSGRMSAAISHQGETA
jgi:hypothetical protein